MPDPLLVWRPKFPILQKKTYLINNSLGAMPRSVKDAFEEYTDLWADEGVVAWDRWLPMVAEVAGILEDITGAPRGSMIMTQNTTNSLQHILRAWSTRRRGTKFALRRGVPTVEYLLDEQRKLEPWWRAGTIRWCSRDEPTPPSPTDLPGSHFNVSGRGNLWTCGPFGESAPARGAGGADAYQSMGAVPFDVMGLGVDFLIGGSVKWLCGGPGAGYLYARPELIEQLQPRFAGWFSHARPFGFEPPPIQYAEGIARFMGGTPNVPAYYQAREGYSIIREVGPRSSEKARRQTQIIYDGARSRGWEVNSPEDFERRGNHVTVNTPRAESVKSELIRRGFVIDYRPGAGIRIAPHFYNTDDECRGILDEIDAILRDG
jgi:kynureninase